METLILDVPVFSGKIISPIWIKAVRDFQSKSKTERDSYCLICGDDIASLIKRFENESK